MYRKTIRTLNTIDTELLDMIEGAEDVEKLRSDNWRNSPNGKAHQKKIRMLKSIQRKILEAKDEAIELMEYL